MSTLRPFVPSSSRAKSRAVAVVVTAFGLCLCVAACSWTGAIQPVADEPQSTQPTAETIEQAAKQVFSVAKMTGAPEISELRRALPSAPAEWLVCLRSNAPPFRVYAIFFKGNQMADYRLAVLYDDCAREMYMPVAPAAAAGSAQR